MQDYAAKKPNSSVNHRLIWDISKVKHRIKQEKETLSSTLEMRTEH